MAAGTYAHTLFSDIVAQVQQELNDSAGIFYLTQETQLAVQETLRLWNTLTGWHRTTEYFNTVPGQAFYDLTDPVVLSNGPLTRTVTSRDLVGTLQYRLMEPYEPIASTGVSEMFAHLDFVRTLQQNRDYFLASTQCVVTQKATIDIGAGVGLVPLDDHTIAVARAVWETDDGRYMSIDVTDESAATSFIPSWRQNPGIPRAVSIALQPELTLQLIPRPLYPGHLHLFTIESGAALDTVANTLIGVPDDVAAGVGWLAMSDLLMHDGIGRAPFPAAFAAQLGQLYMSAAKEMPTVLSVLINNRMVHPSSIDMLDSMRPGWQGKSPSRPTHAAILGDFLALAPVPDAQYAIGVTLVRKTPLYAPGDPIQLGREQLSAIVGWAKQLLLFKKCGVQLEAGREDGQQLFDQAKIYNEERIFSSSYITELYSLSNDDTWQPLRTRTAQTVPGETDRPDTSSTRQPRNAQRRLGGR